MTRSRTLVDQTLARTEILAAAKLLLASPNHAPDTCVSLIEAVVDYLHAELAELGLY